MLHKVAWVEGLGIVTLTLQAANKGWGWWSLSALPKVTGSRVAEAEQRPCPSDPVSIRRPSYPASAVSEGAGRAVGLWLGRLGTETEKLDPTRVFVFDQRRARRPSQVLRCCSSCLPPSCPSCPESG